MRMSLVVVTASPSVEPLSCPTPTCRSVSTAAWAGVKSIADHRAAASATSGANIASVIVTPPPTDDGVAPSASKGLMAPGNAADEISIPDTTQLKFWPPRSTKRMSRTPSPLLSEPVKPAGIVTEPGASKATGTVGPPSIRTSKLSYVYA